MHRYRAVGTAAALAAAAGLSFTPAIASAGPAQHSVHVSMRLIGEAFTPVSERAYKGSVIDTFRSADGTTVSVLGTAGTTVDLHETIRPKARSKTQKTATSGTTGTLDGGTGVSVPEDAPPPDANSGRTDVTDLEALGVSPERAAAFADMNTDTEGATTSSAVPYSHLCLNAKGDKQGNSYLMHGYGCTNVFLKHSTKTRRWFNVKYKFSAWSSDTSWFDPDRLTHANWYVRWVKGRDSLYNWAPDATKPVGTCQSVTVTATSPYGGVSSSANVCPDKLSPIALNGYRSGAGWSGKESSTDTESTTGVQAVDHKRTGFYYYSHWHLAW